jgi:hypothetical protein
MIRNEIMKMYIFIPLIMLLTACSDGGDATRGTDNGEHVWSDQVNTIDKAKGVEDILGESNDRQREDIDRQSQ